MYVADTSTHRSVFHHAQTRPKVSQTDVTINVQQDIVGFNVSAGNTTSTLTRNKRNSSKTTTQIQQLKHNKCNSSNKTTQTQKLKHNIFNHLSIIMGLSIFLLYTGLYWSVLMKSAYWDEYRLIPTSKFQITRSNGSGTCGCSAADEWSEWPAPSQPRRT